MLHSPKSLQRIISKNKDLKSELKILEKNLNIADHFRRYVIYENILDVIHEPIAEGLKIRRKCQWYEHGEKFTSFF